MIVRRNGGNPPNTEELVMNGQAWFVRSVLRGVVRGVLRGGLRTAFTLTAAFAVLMISVLPTGADSAKSRQLVQAMIEAHGGMQKWKNAPTVSFEDTWFAPGSEERSTSKVVVEQGARRAYLDYPADNASIAWDGTRAWSRNWERPAPPRFMALLSYYFANLPWLTMDPGVVVADPGTERLWEDPIEYVTIRMTFEAGVGDTPDDYYVLYLHPESHRLAACRYVVTYDALLPEGVESTPEKILVYDRLETVDGLLVPTTFTVYEVDHTPYYSCEIGNWSFRQKFDVSRMEMSEDAKLDTSKP